jgi:hypothetical protein
MHIRIDYIWLCPNWYNHLLQADIITSSLITNSNHEIVTCYLYTLNIIRNYNISQNYRNNNSRLIYEYNKMTKEM